MAYARNIQDAFQEADEVIGQLISSYASNDDVDTVRDVQRMIEDTAKIAQQREQEAKQAIIGTPRLHASLVAAFRHSCYPICRPQQAHIRSGGAGQLFKPQESS